MIRRSLPLLATGLALSAALAAQSQAPVFRSESNFVQVSAVVTDRDGNFVTGLTAADFEVKEDYSRQTVSTVTLVDLPTGPNAGVANAESAAAYDPQLPANLRVANRRVYLLYLGSGGGSLLDMHAARAARQFVIGYLQPGDIAGIWDPASDIVEFTDDRGALTTAIDGLYRRMLMRVPSEEARGLKRAVDWMSSVQNRRKALVMFSGGVAIGEPSYASGMPVGLAGDMSRRGVGDWIHWDVFSRADVQVYPVDVRGLIAPDLMRLSGSPAAMAAQLTAQFNQTWMSVGNLRSVADLTGGIAVFNTNDYRAGFQRIVDDNSRYYVLGYQSTSKQKRYHPISVKLTRKDLNGARVRARKGYSG